MFTVETEGDNGNSMYTSSKPDDKANAAYCLTLPGKKLYLQPLLGQKKFRHRDNKRGTVKAIYLLEKEELGKVILRSSKSSVVIHKSLWYRHCNFI